MTKTSLPGRFEPWDSLREELKTCCLCGRQGLPRQYCGNDMNGLFRTTDGWRCMDRWTCEGVIDDD